MTVREAKKKRLAAKGWRIGTAREFLGLTAQEEALIELKLQLAATLRRRRIRRRLTQTELARILKSSQSRVAKMESGDPSVSLDLLARSLIALGASPRELARAIA
jgi:DNA-binding XRE family transcriptional regulator